MRNRVDLPQPELHSKAKTSWRRTDRLTDCTATVSPKILTTSSTRTNASASPDQDSAVGRLSSMEDIVRTLVRPTFASSSIQQRLATGRRVVIRVDLSGSRKS